MLGYAIANPTYAFFSSPVSCPVSFTLVITPTVTMISASFEELAQALRILLEADHRAHHGEKLLFVDRAEAVGNIDTALNAVLNSFHSIYDAIEKDLGSHPVNWYQEPELAAILAIRNARHHNKANKIRHLYNYHVQSSAKPQDRKRYVVVDFPATEDGADTFDVHLSWSDFDSFLALPAKESRLNPEAVKAIRSYLDAGKFPEHATLHGVLVSHVFFNVVPLIVNAASKIVPHIKPHIRATSTEAQSFSLLFDGMPPADTHKHVVDAITIFLPE
jgi:hypothetical protein